MAACRSIDLEAWRRSVISANEFQIRVIPFAQSNEWSFRDGRYVHRSGGFFELAGLRAEARHPSLDGKEQLIIRQRRIAINGLLIRYGPSGCESLFQGRVEPGNIGIMQLAPTVQSTEANYRRLHGGKPTAFIANFTADDAAFICDTLQSEEGSRYHGKYNRNVVCPLGPQDVELPANFRFVPFEQLKQIVETPNILNTDSRSVLFCVDWRHLTWPEAPFSAPKNDIALLAARSYRLPLSEAGTAPLEALAWLAKLRAAIAITTEPVAIESLKNWVIEADRISEREREAGFCARQFHIVAKEREVPSWDQPLIDSGACGLVLLLCQERDSALQFLVGASYEIGFLEGVQLSATIVFPPGGDERSLSPVCRGLIDLAQTDMRSTPIAGCVQSEEGGRFYQDENRYDIVMLDPATEVPPSDEHRWMTLSQIMALKSVAGVLTIELRCILALLIKFL